MKELSILKALPETDRVVIVLTNGAELTTFCATREATTKSDVLDAALTAGENRLELCDVSSLIFRRVLYFLHGGGLHYDGTFLLSQMLYAHLKWNFAGLDTAILEAMEDDRFFYDLNAQEAAEILIIADIMKANLGRGKKSHLVYRLEEKLEVLLFLHSIYEKKQLQNETAELLVQRGFISLKPEWCSIHLSKSNLQLLLDKKNKLYSVRKQKVLEEPTQQVKTWIEKELASKFDKWLVKTVPSAFEFEHEVTVDQFKAALKDLNADAAAMGVETFFNPECLGEQLKNEMPALNFTFCPDDNCNEDILMNFEQTV